MCRASVRRATVVAVPSEFVRGTVIEAFGVDPSTASSSCRTASTRPLGRGHGRCGRAAPPASTSATGRCSCYPAITHPHKGHRFLIDLLRRMARPTTCARADRRHAARPSRGDRRRSHAIGLDDRVVRPGRVADADRDGLIARGRGAGLPERVRGLRRAGDRGDGARHAGRLQRRASAARGRRRRRPSVDGRSTVDGVGRRARRAVRADAAELVAAGRARAPSCSPLGASGARARSTPTGSTPLSAMIASDRLTHRRALPALRARHRADRRGDDADRRTSSPPAATSCTSSRRCRGTAATPRAGLGRAAGRGARRPTWGSITRVHPFPATTSATSSAGRSGSSASRRSPAGGARAGAWSAGRRRDRDVAAVDAGAHRVAGAHRPSRRRWCSTSRTCSPTPRSRTGAITDRTASIARRPVARAVTLPPRRRRSPCSATTCATTSPPSCRPRRARRVRVIPNFVDTEAIRPLDRDDRLPPPSSASATSRSCCTPATSASRSRWRWSSRPRRRLPDVTFVINGDGAARATRSDGAAGCRTFASPGTSRRAAAARCSPPATSTSCRCAPGSATSACRRRPTRSWPPAGRCSRRSTPAPRCRGSSPRRARASPCAPDDAEPRSWLRCAALRRRPGRAARRWAPPGGAGSSARRRRRPSAARYERLIGDV